MKNRIVYHVTWQYMKKNRRRTRTALYGIIFMVLLLTCVFVGRETAVSYLETIASAKDGKWHVSVYDVTEKEAGEFKNLEYVSETAVSKDMGNMQFALSANPQRPYLYVKAYEDACFDWMNIRLTEGHLPENDQELLISESARADGSSVKVGDKISGSFFERSLTGTANGVTTVFPFQNMTLTYGQTQEIGQDFPYYEENDSFRENREYTGEEGEYTVAGFIESPSYENADAAGYIALTKIDPQMTVGAAPFHISMMLDLKAEKSYDCAKEIRKIAGSHTVDFNDYVLSFSGKSSDSVVNEIVKIVTVFFLLIITAVSLILIYNLFNMSFEERSRYLGMLCSVGATGRQKRSSVYFEAGVLVLVALPAGLLLGLLMVFTGMLLFQPFIENVMGIYGTYQRVPVSLKVSGSAVAFIVLGSLATVFVSAYLPARKISKTGPIECIRGNISAGRRPHKMKEKIIKRRGAPGMLAYQSLRVQKKKTRGIIRSAAAFMTIFIVTMFGMTSMTRLIRYRMLDSETVSYHMDGWDYVFGMMHGDPATYESLKEEIFSDEGVEAARESYEGISIGNIPWETYGKEYWDALHRVFNLHTHRELSDAEFAAYFEGGSSTMNVVAVDTETFAKIAQATDTDQTILENAAHPVIVVQDGEVSTQNWRIESLDPQHYQFNQVKHMTDLEKGEEIPLELYSAAEEENVDFPLTVAGYAYNEQIKEFMNFHTEQMWGIIECKIADEMDEILLDPETGGHGFTKNIRIRLNGRETGLVKKLEELAADPENGYIYSFIKAGYAKTMADSINAIIRILLICFVLLSSVICLLNLFNSIRGRSQARRQEFAILQSVGATAGQIRKMLFYECAGILLRSIFWTAVTATPLVYILRMALIWRFGHVELAFPAGTYLAAAAIAAVSVWGITLACFEKPDGSDLAARIREENQ